jgi:N-acetylglucosamine transport system substrate-binding protein
MMRLCTLLILSVTLAILGGCGSPSAPETTAEKAPSAPAGGATAKLAGELEVMAFKGGYGIDMYEKAAKEFGEKHPELKISVSGNPRVWEQIRPRMVAGNPPDLMFPGWGMDQWGLVQEGQLLALDDALAQPAYQSQTPWKDTFDAKVLKLGQKDGKTYMLPYYVMVYGWWYDPGVFQRNGWTVPETWDELLALGEKTKAKGIAPITYQGQYPYYMLEGMLFPWVASVGGVEALQAAQNMEPGAWKSPAMLKAAEMIEELNKKGFFQKGATGMSHTESQTQFLNGKAAMIPCGSWLESEMRSVWPKGAQLEYMAVPIVANGTGDPTFTVIGVEPWMIPTDAKNPTAAVELFRYMTSLPKAKEFVEQKGTLMAIVGSEQAKLPKVLVKPAEAVKNAKTLWACQFRQWYPAFQKELEGALTSMLNGELTPQQFVDRVEAEAEKTRNDPEIPKYKSEL